MKTKLFILGLFIGSIILNGCNDTLTQVGTGIQPETDRPTVSVDTFYMQARTVQTDSIYARSPTSCASFTARKISVSFTRPITAK